MKMEASNHKIAKHFLNESRELGRQMREGQIQRSRMILRLYLYKAAIAFGFWSDSTRCHNTDEAVKYSSNLEAAADAWAKRTLESPPSTAIDR